MNQRGFVLIELIVVMAMLSVLIGIVTINTLGADRQATLTGTIDTLVADLRSQQTKAMSGATSGGVIQPGYGVEFQSDRYVLFSGLTYNVGDTSNSVVMVNSRVRFITISLPNNSVVFASKSGEFVGFNAQTNSVTAKQTDSGVTKTVYFNRYGTITSIN